jgi:hypothetical protein
MNSPDNKVMPLGEAVRRYVKPGAHISVGGFTLNRSPMAAVYEIIRQGIKGLHVYAHSNGQAVDELIGAGCVSRLEIAYGGTGKYAATCIRFRRAVQNGDIVFCGTGISMLAAMAAKNINAPQSVIFFETGAVDSLLEELPLAVADPRIMYWSAGNTGLLDAFAVMQNRITGNKVIAILGAAQIDKYGNLNTTCIGDYHRPQIRFSGSRGRVRRGLLWAAGDCLHAARTAQVRQKAGLPDQSRTAGRQRQPGAGRTQTRRREPGGDQPGRHTL